MSRYSSCTMFNFSVSVLAYLALFRLDELGMSHFRQFVRSQDLNRMYRVRTPHTCTYLILSNLWSKQYNFQFYANLSFQYLPAYLNMVLFYAPANSGWAYSVYPVRLCVCVCVYVCVCVCVDVCYHNLVWSRTLLFLYGFWNYLAEMFIIMRRCVMHKTQFHSFKIKVSFRGQG